MNLVRPAVCEIPLSIGSLTSRLFGWVLPGVLIAFTIGRGTAAIAGEEEQHTLNLVLAYPVGRRSAVLQRLAAMTLELLVLTLAFGALALAVGAATESERPRSGFPLVWRRSATSSIRGPRSSMCSAP